MHYESHFGLTRAPFSISPDPAFLYLTHGHREALAHLLYGIKHQGGFVLLTGEIGAGKTTVCRCLLELLPSNIDVALVLNSLLNEADFLAAICDELKISYPDNSSGTKGFMDRIQEYLLESHGEGRDVVLIIDEAQNLNRNVMEQLRLLTNLETSEKKLLQIILIGQPELRDLISQPELQQMAQRITARFHLGALNFREVEAYIRHRLKVAGYDIDTKNQLFTQDSIHYVAKMSGGIPRLINILCDRALLGAYLSNSSVVSLGFCKAAAREVIPGRHSVSRFVMAPALRLLIPVILLLVLGFALSFLLRREALTIPEEEVIAESNLESPPVRPVLRKEAVEVASRSSEIIRSVPHQIEVESSSELNGQHRFDEQSASPQILSDALDSDGPDGDSLDSDTSGGEKEAENEIRSEAKQEGAGKLLLQNSFSSLEREAFKTVFSRWDLTGELDSDTVPCDFATKSGLRCFSGEGDLALLVRLNRPAVLTLYDQRGGKVPAILLGVTDSELTLDLAGTSESFLRSEFGRLWQGEFTLVWHPPTGFNEPVRYGDQGDLVAWLLQQIGGVRVSTEAAVYDSEAGAKIRKFQIESGLVPDGVVGPQTLISLQNLGGEARPGLFVDEVVKAQPVQDSLAKSIEEGIENSDISQTRLPNDIGGQ